MAQLKARDTLTAEKAPAGGVAWPASLAPQQAMLPSTAMPQAWLSLTAAWRSETLGGVPVIGTPQQLTVPAVARAQLVSSPMVTMWNVPWGLALWPASSAPQQMRELSLDTAQLCRAPEAMVQWPTGPGAVLSAFS